MFILFRERKNRNSLKQWDEKAIEFFQLSFNIGVPGHLQTILNNFILGFDSSGLMGAELVLLQKLIGS